MAKLWSGQISGIPASPRIFPPGSPAAQDPANYRREWARWHREQNMRATSRTIAKGNWQSARQQRQRDRAQCPESALREQRQARRQAQRRPPARSTDLLNQWAQTVSLGGRGPLDYAAAGYAEWWDRTRRSVAEPPPRSGQDRQDLEYLRQLVYQLARSRTEPHSAPFCAQVLVQLIKNRLLPDRPIAPHEWRWSYLQQLVQAARLWPSEDSQREFVQMVFNDEPWLTADDESPCYSLLDHFTPAEA